MLPEQPALQEGSEVTLPANHPDRDKRDPLVEAAYRCRECNRPWLVWAVHGEPTDGVDDPRKCRFCEDGIGRRIR